jgi:hypothetical protein
MADSKTSALPAVASVVDAQEFPVNDGGVSKKATAAQIKTYANAGLIAGSTGATDNAVLRADGAGGATAQASAVTIDDTGNVTFPARILGRKGADVASAAGITLGNGNYFNITGTTTIDTISSTGWTSGSLVYLRFTASLTVRHNQAGDFDPIQLMSAANLGVGAGDVLVLLYDNDLGTWMQAGYENL